MSLSVKCSLIVRRDGSARTDGQTAISDNRTQRSVPGSAREGQLASKTERVITNAAGLVQGLVLVTSRR
jgi:hypothetical protein